MIIEIFLFVFSCRNLKNTPCQLTEISKLCREPWKQWKTWRLWLTNAKGKLRVLTRSPSGKVLLRGGRWVSISVKGRGVTGWTQVHGDDQWGYVELWAISRKINWCQLLTTVDGKVQLGLPTTTTLGTEVLKWSFWREWGHLHTQRKKANNCKTAFFNDSTVTEAFSLLAVLKVRQRGRVVTALDLQFGSPALTASWICSW